MVAPRHFALFALLFCRAAHGQWFGDIAVESQYNDNLPRAERASNAHGDLSLGFTTRGGYHVQPGDFTGLTLSTSLTGVRYDTYEGLNNIEAGLGVNLSHKFGLGERVPQLSFDAGVARASYRTDIRDAWIYSTGLTLSKRLDERFSLSGFLRHETSDGDHSLRKTPPPAPKPGNVWDFDVLTAGLQSEVDLGPATWLGASYRYQHGDVVSSSPTYARIVAAATAITNDPVFGPATIAYRLPASTQLYSVDINRAVLDAGTVYFGLEYQDTSGENEIDYAVKLIRAGFIYGF